MPVISPTETLTDSRARHVLMNVPELLLHVSRGVRWDSDHVVILDDHLRAIMEKLVRGDYLGRTHIRTILTPASIASPPGRSARATRIKALLSSRCSSPPRNYQHLGNAVTCAARLAWNGKSKSLPFAAVWDEHCRRQNVPVGGAWIAEIKAYEKAVLAQRVSGDGRSCFLDPNTRTLTRAATHHLRRGFFRSRAR